LEAIRGRSSRSGSGPSRQESPVEGLGEKEGEDEAGGSSGSGGDMETDA